MIRTGIRQIECVWDEAHAWAKWVDMRQIKPHTITYISTTYGR